LIEINIFVRCVPSDRVGGSTIYPAHTRTFPGQVHPHRGCGWTQSRDL